MLLFKSVSLTLSVSLCRCCQWARARRTIHNRLWQWTESCGNYADGLIDASTMGESQLPIRDRSESRRRDGGGSHGMASLCRKSTWCAGSYAMLSVASDENRERMPAIPYVKSKKQAKNDEEIKSCWTFVTSFSNRFYWLLKCMNELPVVDEVILVIGGLTDRYWLSRRWWASFPPFSLLPFPWFLLFT